MSPGHRKSLLVNFSLGFPQAFPDGAQPFRNALMLFWLVDGLLLAAFIAARLLVFAGTIRFVPDLFAISREYSIPESFNYLKWLLCVICLGLAWWRCRTAVFACLALLFAMIFADDLFLGHETLGQVLADAGIPSAFGLDAKQIGEIVIFGVMGVIALLLIALGHRLSPPAFRPFLYRYLLIVLALGVVGVAFDGVHHMAVNLPDSRARTLLELTLTLIEDGGEMVLASLAAAFAVGAAFVQTGAEAAVSPRPQAGL